MEHLHHFGLPQDPFSNEPDLRFFFESASHRDAQRRVERGLRQQKGLTLLTGEGGMGKTLLARRILDGLEEEVFEATLLVILPGAADATGILQRFARQLGCEEPATDRATLLGQLYEQLAIVREDGRHAVLIVDDAQIMTPEVFAELGGLLNLEYEDRRLVSMLFVGSPELDRLVENDPSIMPRVDVRVRLQPLDMQNTTAYLTHRIEAVQGNSDVIPPEAVQTLFKFGRGRPRLLNTLADNALFEAYLSGRPAIDSTDIERAAADLGVGSDPGTTFTQLFSAPLPPVTRVVDDALAPAVTSPAVDAPLFPNSIDGALDLDEPVADFELAPVAAESAAEVATVPPALDLDAGLDSALAGFDEPNEVSRLLDSAEFGDGSLELEMEQPNVATPADVPAGAEPADPILELIESEPVFESNAVFESDPVLAKGIGGVEVTEELSSIEDDDIESLEFEEAEMSPLGFEDADELDNAFVELLEE